MSSPLKTASVIGFLMFLLQFVMGAIVGRFFLGLLIATGGALWLGYQVIKLKSRIVHGDWRGWMRNETCGLRMDFSKPINYYITISIT